MVKQVLNIVDIIINKEKQEKIKAFLFLIIGLLIIFYFIYLLIKQSLNIVEDY